MYVSMAMVLSNTQHLKANSWKKLSNTETELKKAFIIKRGILMLHISRSSHRGCSIKTAVFKKIRKIYRKALVPESLFNEGGKFDLLRWLF